MSRLPKYLNKETTRKRSFKQESRIAKQLKGHLTVNSGATFGQNDVITDFAEIEAKTTNNKSFSVHEDTWAKLRTKCKGSKIPIIQVDLRDGKTKLAVIAWDDLIYLINAANKTP